MLKIVNYHVVALASEGFVPRELTNIKLILKESGKVDVEVNVEFGSHIDPGLNGQRVRYVEETMASTDGVLKAELQILRACDGGFPPYNVYKEYPASSYFRIPWAVKEE